MTHRIRPAGLLAGLLITLLPAGSLAAPARGLPAAPPPVTALPRLHDVTTLYGSGFRVRLSLAVTRGQAASLTAAGLSPQLLARLGFQSARLLEYSRNMISYSGSSFTTKPGVSAVTIAVERFKTAQGARGMISTMTAGGALHLQGVTYHVIPVAGIGQLAERTTFTQPNPVGGGTLNNVAIAFQRGRYLGTLNVQGSGPIDTAAVEHLARVEDGLLKRLG